MKVRYYPGGNAPRGVSIGAAGGFASWNRTNDPNVPEPLSGPTFSMFADYQALLGRQKRVAFGVGAGLKRHAIRIPRNVAAGQPADPGTDGGGEIYPTLRISFGRAF